MKDLVDLLAKAESHLQQAKEILNQAKEFELTKDTAKSIEAFIKEYEGVVDILSSKKSNLIEALTNVVLLIGKRIYELPESTFKGLASNILYVESENYFLICTSHTNAGQQKGRPHVLNGLITVLSQRNYEAVCNLMLKEIADYLKKSESSLPTAMEEIKKVDTFVKHLVEIAENVKKTKSISA